MTAIKNSSEEMEALVYFLSRKRNCGLGHKVYFHTFDIINTNLINTKYVSILLGKQPLVIILLLLLMAVS